MKPLFNITFTEAVLILVIIGFVLALGGCVHGN